MSLHGSIGTTEVVGSLVEEAVVEFGVVVVFALFDGVVVFGDAMEVIGSFERS